MTMTRTKRVKLTFQHSFSLEGVDRQSRLANTKWLRTKSWWRDCHFRFIAAWLHCIFLPVDSRGSATEMVPVDPHRPCRSPRSRQCAPCNGPGNSCEFACGALVGPDIRPSVSTAASY